MTFEQPNPMEMLGLKPFAEKPKMNLQAQINPDGDKICIEFVLTGELERIVIPKLDPNAGCQDELWKRTCFECFVQKIASGGYPITAYREYNFSPSGAWATYDFENYRQLEKSKKITAPNLIFSNLAHEKRFLFELSTEDFPSGELAIGLTAVLEHESKDTNPKSTELSYWALEHPNPEKADFHDARGFKLNLKV